MEMTSKVAVDDGLLASACAMADIAGKTARKYFRTVVPHENKQDGSPVTIADKAIEAELRRMIRLNYPLDGILGEEEEAVALDSDCIWVVDPIDGTKSFMTGMPTFGTLIARLENGAPQLGVIDIPAMNERWIGMRGVPTTMNGSACHTSNCRHLADAALYATSPDFFEPEEAVLFETVSRKAAMRRFGGDCYSYALLASGHVDAVVEASLKPFDFLALVPVIEGAGGVVTDWEGKALGIDSSERVVASATPELHAEILQHLKG